MVDVLVLGGGHAGVEAALACARMKQKTMLLTMHINMIASMPCNPSVGGPAKGIVVREIDALGGLMGKVADRSHFQIKMLNNAKGPAVRSLRAQADKITYPQVMLEYLHNTPNLTIIEGMVENLIILDNIAQGVIVPTSKGYFEIKLESTGTELPFEYTLKVKQEEDLDNSIPDFKITSYILNDNEIIELDPDQTEIVGTVEPPKDVDGKFTGQEVINNFIIYVEWEDTENNVLDNQGDVAISKNPDTMAIIPIELNIKQIQ